MYNIIYVNIRKFLEKFVKTAPLFLRTVVFVTLQVIKALYKYDRICKLACMLELLLCVCECVSGCV